LQAVRIHPRSRDTACTIGEMHHGAIADVDRMMLERDASVASPNE